MLFSTAPFSSTPFSVQLAENAIVSLQGVTVTGAVGSPLIIIPGSDSLTLLNGLLISATINTVNVTTDSNTTLESTEALALTGQVTVAVNINAVPSGVASQGSIGIPVISVESNSSVIAEGVSVTGLINFVSVSAESSTTLDSISSTFNIGILEVETQFVHDIVGVSLVSNTGNLNVTTAVFDYESIKESFDRNRVIFIERTNQKYSISIPTDPINKTLLIEATNTDRVVRIAA
jgi:hypothetical protein